MVGALPLLGCLSFLDRQSIWSHSIKVRTRAVSHEMAKSLAFEALGWALSVSGLTPIHVR